MRIWGVVAAALALTACGQGEPEVVDGVADAAPVGDLREQLAKGDGKACTDRGVLDVVHNVIVERRSRFRYFDAWSAEDRAVFDSGLAYGVDTVTLAQVNTSIQSVVCSGTYYADWQGQGGRQPILYSIQPTLDSDDYAVYVDDIDVAMLPYLRATSAYFNANIRNRGAGDPAPIADGAHAPQDPDMSNVDAASLP